MRDQCSGIVWPLDRCQLDAEWEVKSEAIPDGKKLCHQHLAGYLHSRYPNTVTYLKVVSAE